MGQLVTFYDFNERLAWSAGFLDAGIAQILQDRLPGCTKVVKATNNEDRSGTDYWAIRDDLPPLSVDVKVRQKDYGKDDVALETWSVLGEKVGWTRDFRKRTDFVLWHWQDSGRFFLVSFPALCEVFTRYWENWSAKYKTAVQTSGSWKSECVFVPKTALADKLNAWRVGKL